MEDVTACVRGSPTIMVDANTSGREVWADTYFLHKTSTRLMKLSIPLCGVPFGGPHANWIKSALCLFSFFTASGLHPAPWYLD